MANPSADNKNSSGANDSLIKDGITDLKDMFKAL